MMRTGAVAYELCRPLDLYGLWYARALALADGADAAAHAADVRRRDGRRSR